MSEAKTSEVQPAAAQKGIATRRVPSYNLVNTQDSRGFQSWSTLVLKINSTVTFLYINWIPRHFQFEVRKCHQSEKHHLRPRTRTCSCLRLPKRRPKGRERLQVDPSPLLRLQRKSTNIQIQIQYECHISLVISSLCVF